MKELSPEKLAEIEAEANHWANVTDYVCTVLLLGFLIYMESGTALTAVLVYLVGMPILRGFTRGASRDVLKEKAKK